MKKTLLILLTTVLLLLPSGPVLSADREVKGPFSMYAGDALSFFVPISGNVTAVEGKYAIIDIGAGNGVRTGMRLTVFREGDEFFHPVTGEPLGRIETEKGVVEVVDVSEDMSRIKVISGDVKVGDRVRISKGTVPVLFYQTRSVDWAVGDALFRAFRKTGRFDLVETDHDADDMQQFVEDMTREGVTFGILVRQWKEGGTRTLEVGFYHADGTIFYKDRSVLTEDLMDELKFGYTFLKDVETSFQLSFEVPASTEMIAACDVDGDGTDDLVMAGDGTLEVFRFGVALKLLYYAETDSLREVVWLDCGDLPGGPGDEIVITMLSEDIEQGGAEDDGTVSAVSPVVEEEGVMSEVFALVDGKLRGIFRTAGFLRIAGSSLYYQRFSATEGFSDGVWEMKERNGAGFERGERLVLPPGVDIYGFMPVSVGGESGYMITDNAGYLNLFNSEGVRVWRSAERVAWFVREYEIPASVTMMDSRKWNIKERIIGYRGRFFMIKRKPFVESARGLGFSSAGITAFRVKGIMLEEETVVDDIGGTMLDFAIINEKMVVLVRPFLGMKFSNIFQGRNPFKRNIYVFALK